MILDENLTPSVLYCCCCCTFGDAMGDFLILEINDVNERGLEVVL